MWLVAAVKRYGEDGQGDTAHRVFLLPCAGKRGDAQRCRQLKVNGYLTKPVIHSELYDALKAILHGKKQPGKDLVTRHQVREAKRRLTILLVDDVEINRELAKIILEKQGHQVLLANDGQDALEQARKGGFDLILMDIQMPVLGGVEALEAIRAEEKAQGGHLPVIALTADALKGTEEKLLKAGFDGYLTKPVRTKELADELTRLTAG